MSTPSDAATQSNAGPPNYGETVAEKPPTEPSPAEPTPADPPVQQEQPAPAQEAPSETTSAIDSLNLPLSASDGPLIQKPFFRPLDTAKPSPPPQLTPDQQAKYDSVLKSVSEWTAVPNTSAKNASSAPLTDDERMFLTRECLLRYLRATKWNAPEAVSRLQRTLTWRREYGIEKLTPDYISVENETGKQVLLGFDIHGRPCLYLLPSNQNTEKSDRQVQHLVFMLERAIDLMPADQETLALIVDYSETKSGQNASIGQARDTVSFLQNHYPERLGRALVINSEGIGGWG